MRLVNEMEKPSLRFLQALYDKGLLPLGNCTLVSTHQVNNKKHGRIKYEVIIKQIPTESNVDSGCQQTDRVCMDSEKDVNKHPGVEK